MSTYFIGDVQGCDDCLGQLLDRIAFSPSRDQLVLLGDLVNRGPASAAVLRRLSALGDAAQCLLGNHDLHLLAVSQGVRPLHRQDTLAPLLAAPDAPALLEWLRYRPLALMCQQVLAVHAGVLPAWSASQTLALAAEVQAQLRGSLGEMKDFLHQMYGNEPAAWDEGLQGMQRLRVIVNALTRLRWCSPEGVMEFKSKEGMAAAPEGCLPWFDVPGRRSADTVIAFGHWSTLGWRQRPDILPLDTGCVWGGQLSALRLGAHSHDRELIQLPCPPYCQP